MYQSRGGTAFLVDQPAMERSKAANPNSIEKVEHMVVSYGPSLVRIYKSIIHRNFPVVEEGFFMNYENGVKAHLDPALLAAIYVLAVPWLPDSSRTSPLVPDEASLEHMAFSLFGDSLINPSLSTIQAGLLLMQRPNIDSKTLNTQLVSAAYELGLQLDCTSWTTTDKGLRKRLAWALYMQDKWCSLIHGRPSLVSSNNWAVRLLEDEDFDYVPADAEEQAKAEIGQLIFKQMVSLTEILAMVLDTFYTLKAMSIVEDAEQGGTRLILERAKPVQIRLKEWFGGLPPVLKMETSSTNTPTGPAGLPIAVTSRKPSTTGTFTPHSHPSTPLTFALMTGYMHLAYFATEITLHRCIIRSLQAISITDPYLTHICRSAAKTRLISAMDFVNRLRPDHLNAFWYFPSRVSFALIGTFGSLLLATAPAQEEVDFYRTRLGEYRWTLGVSARKAHFLTFAVESLDNSSDLLKSLPRRPSTADVASAAAAAAPRSPPRESMPSPPRMQMPGYGQLPIVLEGDGSDREMEDASGLVSPSLSSGSGEGFDFNPSVSGGFARGQEQYD